MAKTHRKLIQLSAFWKNDQPGGIALTLTQEFGDLDFAFNTIRTNYEEMYAHAVLTRSVEVLIQDMLSQLELFAARKVENMDMEAAFLTIGNVYLLEKLRRIPTDEFNGLMFAYAHNPGTMH